MGGEDGLSGPGRSHGLRCSSPLLLLGAALLATLGGRWRVRPALPFRHPWRAHTGSSVRPRPTADAQKARSCISGSGLADAFSLRYLVVARDSNVRPHRPFRRTESLRHGAAARSLPMALGDCLCAGDSFAVGDPVQPRLPADCRRLVLVVDLATPAVLA